MKQIWETYPTNLLEYPETLLSDAPGIPAELFRSTEQLISTSKKSTRKLSASELPINNYLKTKEEIDAEFRFVASSHKSALKEKETPSDSYGRIVKMAEAYSYLHSIDQALAAPLEENY